MQDLCTVVHIIVCRKHVLGHSDHSAPTQQCELDPSDHTDQESIYLSSLKEELNHGLLARGVNYLDLFRVTDYSE